MGHLHAAPPTHGRRRARPKFADTLAAAVLALLALVCGPLGFATGQAQETSSQTEAPIAAPPDGGQASDAAGADAVTPAPAADSTLAGTPPTPAAPPGPKLPPSALPDTIYLRNERGELIPMIGWRFEDFAAMYRQPGGAAAPPPYEIELLDCLLVEQADAIRVEADVQIRSSRAGWITVDLGLPQLLLSAPPEIQGAQQHWIRHEDPSGWRLWLETLPDQPIRAHLRGIVAAQRFGGQTRVHLTLPDATRARATLEPLDPRSIVQFNGRPAERQPPGTFDPSAEATTEAPAEASAEATELRSTEADQSSTTETPVRFSADGLAGEIEVRWQPAGSGPPPTRGIWEATLNLDLRVDGPQSVSALGDLELASYGEPVGEFRVELPPGTQLLPIDVTDPGARYDVETRPRDDQPERTEAVFRLHAPQSRLRVRFQAVTSAPRTDGDATDDAWLRCADYTVVGALRQTGRVRLLASEDWAVQWQETSLARTTDPGPLTSAADSELLAAWAIYQQPCGLALQVRPRESRVDVEPEYWLRFNRADVELVGRFKYHIRGAKAPRLEIDSAGWGNVRASIEGGSAIEPTVIQDAERITIQLPAAVRGELVVQLTAQRPLQEPTGRVVLPLPRPAGVLLPSRVVLAASGNRTIAPVTGEMPDTTTESAVEVAPSGLPADWTSLPAVGLRMPREASALQLVVDIAAHQREVDVQQVNKIRLGARSILVREIFSYSVAYDPLTSVTFRVPADIGPSTEVNWTVNGVRVNPSPVAPGTSTASEAGPTSGARQRLSLPVAAAGAGNFEVVVSYALPYPALTSGPLPVTIPLVTSDDAAIRDPETHWFRDAGAVRLEAYSASGWSVDEALRRRVGCELALTADRPLDQCTVVLRPGVPGEPPRTSVHGGWVQTWLTDGIRFDRAVYHIETRDSTLHCRVPRGFDPDQSVCSVNGARTTIESPQPGVLIIRLPELREGRGVVELAYRLPYQSTGWRTSLDLPQLDQAVWLSRWVWQVVVEPGQHLALPPPALARLDRWTWHGWYWARSSTWQQDDLETWLQASHQPPIPPSAHQYTFTALRPVETVQLWLVQQRVILLTGAGLAVVLSLLLLQFPVLRQWGFCVPLAFVLLSLGAWAPTPAVMLGQAAVVGVMAVLVTRLGGHIWRSVRRRRSWDAPSTRIRVPTVPAPRSSTTGSALSSVGERP